MGAMKMNCLLLMSLYPSFHSEQNIPDVEQANKCSFLLLITCKCVRVVDLSVQNAAARIIARLRKYDHISQTLKDLHWLPVEQRIAFKINLIIHKVLNGTAPHYLQELLNRYEPLRRLRSSSDKWRFAIRRYNQETYGRRAFATMAPKLWNKLPLELRSISKSNIFKSSLKTYLFKLAYDL